jgi:hypothetical protein
MPKLALDNYFSIIISIQPPQIKSIKLGSSLVLVRAAESAVLGFPQVEHLSKTGGLCSISDDFNRCAVL